MPFAEGWWPPAADDERMASSLIAPVVAIAAVYGVEYYWVVGESGHATVAAHDVFVVVAVVGNESTET